ncbi:MAG: nucleotidyltransferase domain-containing protein [Calditrichota bacterium]
MGRISQDKLNLIVKRLVEAAQPIRIIMFGSYARGDATEDSDLDLLVIKRDVENRGQEMSRLREAVGKVGIGVDVLVYTEEEVQTKRDWSSTAIYWAVREGKALYEAG